MAAYTWLGLTTNCATATNWTPTRASPSPTDVLTVGTGSVTQPGNGAITFATMAVSGAGISGGTFTGAVTATAGVPVTGQFNNLTVDCANDFSGIVLTSGGTFNITGTSVVPDIGPESGPMFSGPATVTAAGDLTIVCASTSGMDIASFTITIGGNFTAVVTPLAIDNSVVLDFTGTTITTNGSNKVCTLVNTTGTPTKSGFVTPGSGGGSGGGNGKMGLSL